MQEYSNSEYELYIIKFGANPETISMMDDDLDLQFNIFCDLLDEEECKKYPLANDNHADEPALFEDFSKEYVARKHEIKHEEPIIWDNKWKKTYEKDLANLFPS